MNTDQFNRNRTMRLNRRLFCVNKLKMLNETNKVINIVHETSR